MNRGWYTGVRLGENPTTTVAVLPVGTFKTAKYGTVELGEERAQRIVDNFNANVLKTDVRFDIQHYMEEAAGWIVPGSARLGEVPHPVTGEDMRVVLVDAEWTPVGTKLLSEKQYRYVSSYIDSYKDEETGKVYNDVLKAVALCNDPVMKMLPPVEVPTGVAASEQLVLSEALGEDKRQSLTVEVGNLKTDHVAMLTELFAAMAYLGNVGSSRAITLFADGDGDFRPSVKLNGEEPQLDGDPKHISVKFGDVVDELKRRERQQDEMDTPPELRAAVWGAWDALCSIDTLIGDAIRSGMTGETLAARIGELCADLPDAIVESIRNNVERANDPERTPDMAVENAIEQTDPTSGAATSTIIAAEGDTADLLSAFDTLMDDCAETVKGAKGVRDFRAFAKATRAKLAAILGQKGVTESMSEPNEGLELAEKQRDEALAKLADYQRKERAAALDALTAKLAEKGVAEPAIALLKAIAGAEDTGAIKLSEGGDAVDLATALSEFADKLEVVPVKPDLGGQGNEDDKVELSEERKQVRAQLRTDDIAE